MTVNQEQIIEALMREFASHELRLYANIVAKLDDFGKLSKEVLELVEKHKKSDLSDAERFMIFHILSKQMFRAEMMGNPRFKEVCEYLVAFHAVRNMQEHENMSAEAKIAHDYENAMNDGSLDIKGVKIKLPNAEAYKKVQCVMCLKPLSECKCDTKKIECSTCGKALHECKCTRGYG